MLRAKLGLTKNGDWELQASDYTAKNFILELHSVDTEEELIGTVSKIRARLSRSHAPAFAAIVFEMTSGPRMLALAAHGAIMDTTAWQIFAKKLASQLGHDERWPFTAGTSMNGLWRRSKAMNIGCLQVFNISRSNSGLISMILPARRHRSLFQSQKYGM
jgi:hypothetical protein